MFSPSLERATQIPIPGPRKVAIDLAGRFEEAILAQGYGSGVFGPERNLISRYEASSKTVRQALRILESRFLGNMRRGVGGGLVLRTPALAESAELMAIYLCAIGARRQDVSDAAAMLQPELADRSEGAKAFVQALFEALDKALDEDHGPQVSTARCRALMVARRIVADLHRNPSAGPATMKLGTLVDLQQQHASGRPIILQAIRILEELEIIEARLGRGGGIVARQPSPGAVVRAVYPHFMLRNLTLDIAGEIIWSINRANAVRAAAIIDAEQAGMLMDLADSLRSKAGSRQDHCEQVMLWRMLGDISGNKAIHMLVRCLFYFRVRSSREVSEHIASPLSEDARQKSCDIACSVAEMRAADARKAVISAEFIAAALPN